MHSPIARAIASAILLFLLLEAARSFTQSRDQLVWLVDWRWLPSPLRALFWLAAIGSLSAFILRPSLHHTHRLLLGAGLLPLAATSLFDAARFILLTQRGSIASPILLSASLILLLSLALILRAILTTTPPPRFSRSIYTASLAVALIAFPLLQMLTFGLTDYRRRADAIVVFGAGVSADGRASSALLDRVRTACDLYDQGLAPTLVFSGGPGPGSTSEPAAMRTLALAHGIPETAIILDDHGLSTSASISNTSRLATDHHWTSVLAVSHFYHLPRIKLESQHAGLTTFTVAARQRRTLRRLPWFMAREVAASWTYYVRTLTS